jgi:hypothetical protein
MPNFCSCDLVECTRQEVGSRGMLTKNCKKALENMPRTLEIDAKLSTHKTCCANLRAAANRQALSRSAEAVPRGTRAETRRFRGGTTTLSFHLLTSQLTIAYEISSKSFEYILYTFCINRVTYQYIT